MRRASFALGESTPRGLRPLPTGKGLRMGQAPYPPTLEGSKGAQRNEATQLWAVCGATMLGVNGKGWTAEAPSAEPARNACENLAPPSALQAL